MTTTTTTTTASPSSSLLFTNEEKHRLREKAQTALAQLTTEAAAAAAATANNKNNTTLRISSGIQDLLPPGNGYLPAATTTTTFSSVRSRFFHSTGFCKVDNFCPIEECQRLKDEMARLVETQWHPPDSNCCHDGDEEDEDDVIDDDDEKRKPKQQQQQQQQRQQQQQQQQQQPLDSFGTDDKQNMARGDYFLDSADKVHFFAEPAALQKDNNKLLLPQFQGSKNKINALNKAGHGLHLLQPGPFYDYTHSPKVQHLVKDELGWTHPVVPQSMYIFKQAMLGGAVNSHQDSTFLFTTPHQSCLGLWLALDDATLDNGCLWVRPKSHLEPVRRHYRRNPRHFQKQKQQQPQQQNPSQADDDNNNNDDDMVPKFIMQELETSHNVTWDGTLPDDLIEAGFIPIECRAGDLLAFAGQLDHLSLPNTSDKARHTFQLHLVDAATTVWSPHNWMQYPDGKDFVAL